MVFSSRSLNKCEAGFTLIEVIVVTAIVGILAAVAVPSGFNFWASIQQEEAQSTINSALRTARTNARASLSGSVWTVSIAPRDPGPNPDSSLVQVIRIQDENGDCNQLLPCQTIPLNNFVNVTDNFAGVGAAFNSRGEATNVGGGLGGTGTFTVNSRVIPTFPRRCVIVSTLLGAIRTGVGDECT